MVKQSTYIGIDKDEHAGMTSIGRVIRDAWVFGLLPETETCEGWSKGRIDALVDQVNTEWDKYGCLVSHLPEDLKARHEKIHREAMAKSRQEGWSGEVEIEDDK